MKRGILVFFAFVAIVFGQSFTPNCGSTDVYFLYDNFDSSYSDIVQPITYYSFGGPDVRMGLGFPVANELTYDREVFIGSLGTRFTTPLTVAGLEGVVELMREQSPVENRRVLVIFEYGNTVYPQSNILAAATRIKQNASYPVEIVVVAFDTTSSFYYQDLASGSSHYIYAESEEQVVLDTVRAINRVNSTFCSVLGNRVATFDGSSFGFNGLGDFWLLRDEEFQVQVRLAPCNDDEPTKTTCVRSVAYSYSNDRYEYSYDPITNQVVLLYDGDTYPLTSFNVAWDFGDVNTLYLPGFDTPFTHIEVALDSYAINMTVGNGLGFAITINSTNSFGRARGLCGTFDGCKENDFFSANQMFVNPSASAADIYNGFANSWRVDSQDSLFTYGVNQEYYYPEYPEYTKEWDPIMGLSGVSETAASNCGFFSDKSKYFYDSCTEGYSRSSSHGAAARGIALFQLAYTCADFCFTGRLDNPIVDIQYCQSTCPVGNDLDLHNTNYTTDVPHLLQTSQWGAKFQAALGGTYTLELQSEFCYQPQINITINVVCDASPSVNAGSDRTIRRVNQNYNPSVVLQATATDVNTAHLQYSWKLIEYPAIDNTTYDKVGLKWEGQPHLLPIELLLLNFERITFNSPTLYIEHNVFLSGKWVWEVAVFDGCSIVRDNVTLEYVCETCDAVALEPFRDIVYHSDYSQSSSYYANFYHNNWETFALPYASIVDNSNNYEVDQTDINTYNFFTYHNNHLNTTVEVEITNSTDTDSDSEPFLMNERFTRYEGSAEVEFYSFTLTETTTTLEYYDSPDNYTLRCQIYIDSPRSSSSSTVSVTDEYGYVRADMFDGAVHNCLGDYTFRASLWDYGCGVTEAFANLRVNCSTSPVAHLITCQNTINYDYTNQEWPQVMLDGRDSRDFDGDTLYYRYEVASQPALGSNDQYLTCNGGGILIGNNVYSSCPTTTTFVPTWPGDYTIKLTVGDDCTFSSETTTVRAVCENITPTLTLLEVPDSRNTTKANYYTLVANTSVVTENPVSYSYRFVDIPAGAPLPDPMAGNTALFTTDLYRGGSYTVEVLVSDGCWSQGVNRTFTYACATAPALSGIAAPASTWGDQGGAVYGFSTSTITATVAYAPAGRIGTISIELVSAPDSSTRTFTDSTISLTPTWNFTPDVSGSYIFQITADDACSVRSQNVTLTASCAALTASFSIAQTTYVWNGTDGISVDFDATSGTAQTTGVYYTYIIQSPQPGSAPIVVPLPENVNDYSFPGVNYIGVWTVTLFVEDGCGVRNTTRTFTVNCQWNIAVNAITAQTKVYGNNRFDRVTFIPTLTTNYPEEYALTYRWDVRSAPVNSVFAPYNQTFVTVNNNTVVIPFTPVAPSLYISGTVETITTTTTVATRTVTLANGVAAESYAVCFSPDLAGTYTTRITVDGFCAGQFATQTATLTATCNDAPVVNAGEDRTVTLQGVYTETWVHFNGTATDANNDKLSYTWSFASVPADSLYNISDDSAAWINRHSLVSGFLPDVAGVYTLQLSATDGCSTTTDTVTITVACNNNFTIPQSLVRQTQNFDGYTPVAFREFSIVATPQCDRDFEWTLTNFVPTPVVAPPTPEPEPQPTAGASQIAASLLVILSLFVFLF